MDQSFLSNCDKLFPTRGSATIFFAYISLFVSQGLLVTAVQKSRIHGFNSIVVVLLTELTKLLICIVVYLIRTNCDVLCLIKDVKKNIRLLALYLIPSFLYCLYNNLTFINLELFDLTTYYCLMQFRIVLTAIIYQLLFRRKLSATQWVSLILLTVGCLIKEYGLYNNATSSDVKTNSFRIHNVTSKSPDLKTTWISAEPSVNFAELTLLLILQMFCSCFAGVYNEYLLKDSSTANNADVILQNVYMYLDSIFCNILVFKLASDSDRSKSGSEHDRDVLTTLRKLLASPLVVALILNNAFSGLVASFFLKSLNSILKTFASALELFAIAFLAWLLFGDKVDAHTILALVTVSIAMVVYTKSPVSVDPPSRTERSKEGFMLLSTSED